MSQVSAQPPRPIEGILRIKNNIVSLPLPQKATIHQVTTMLATSKNVLFSGHNHLLTTSADDPSLHACMIIKVLGHQYWWVAGG